MTKLSFVSLLSRPSVHSELMPVWIRNLMNGSPAPDPPVLTITLAPDAVLELLVLYTPISTSPPTLAVEVLSAVTLASMVASPLMARSVVLSPIRTFEAAAV